MQSPSSNPPEDRHKIVSPSRQKEHSSSALSDVSLPSHPEGSRFKLPTVSSQHWSLDTADHLIKRFGVRQTYTCAAGISPSGVVHFGNFRDVMTSALVVKALESRGVNARFIFSWDDFDRLRKIPPGIDASFVQHIGKPLSSVPDPQGEFKSWAERHEKKFEQAMRQLGIEMEYRYQTAEYASGRYDTAIIEALNARHAIADILLSFMSEKGKTTKSIDPVVFRETFYPISVYSRFSGKDSVTIERLIGDSKIQYRCHETGKVDEVDLTTDRIAKLSWEG